MIATPGEVAARVDHLRRLPPAAGCVSVYLNTRWSDEHQRDRTSVFLTRELQGARQAGVAAADDLAWIEREGDALVAQTSPVQANGVALFACRELGLREILAVRAPFRELFVVADRPDLRPLVAMLEDREATLVAFVDGESARLIPLYATGPDEEVRLEGDVPGRHSRGGWAELAQTKYARHIETHRHQHFEAAAQALTDIVDAQKIQRILLAGHEDRLSAFRAHLPERLQPLVVGVVHAARWESTSAILARAAERLDLQERSDEVVAVDDVLTEAAKGGQAVAGEGTLEAARRAAIHRLYILAGLRRLGRECERCRALQESGAKCWLCGGSTHEIDLGAKVVDRVVSTGGSVETVAEHRGLAAAGGMAALLRYPLSRAPR